MKARSVFLCLYGILVACALKENALASADDGVFVERTRAELNRPRAPGQLCIYYGYSSLVNNAKGNLALATAEFARFNLTVLGDGLWQPTHPDHAYTKTIIGNISSPNQLVFGYVDLSVSTNNHSLAVLQQ